MVVESDHIRPELKKHHEDYEPIATDRWPAKQPTA
jgi:hypothetical protein